MDNLKEQTWFQTREELRDSTLEVIDGLRLWRRLALAGWITVLLMMVGASFR